MSGTDHVAEIIKLIEEGKLDDANEYFAESFFWALSIKDIAYVIDCGVDVRHANDLVFVNSCSHNIEIVKYLFENHDVDVNAQEGEALCKAIKDRKKDIIEYLLKNDIIVTDGAIFMAIIRGHVDLIELMLAHGLDPNRVAQLYLEIPSLYNMLKMLSEHIDITAAIEEHIVAKQVRRVKPLF